MKTVIAGYPRIGRHRELKFATEAWLRGEIDETALSAKAREIRIDTWKTLKARGIDTIPCNDFSLYDAMLDTAALIDAVPARFRRAGLSPMKRYFAMARGYRDEGAGIDLKALPMRKWFNTNYHYIVSELDDETEFTLVGDKPFSEYREALEAGIVTRPFIIGPFTFLALSSLVGRKKPADYAEGLISVYRDILAQCAREGIAAVEFGESALATDLGTDDVRLFESLYRGILAVKGPTSVYLHTSFGDLRDCWTEAMALPFDGIALDFVEGYGNLELLERHGFPEDRTLTAGVINGKNVWKSDIARARRLIGEIERLSGCTEANGRLSIGASCSLLHVPVSLACETGLDQSLRARLSFAEEKVSELVEFVELAGISRSGDSAASSADAAKAAEAARPADGARDESSRLVDSLSARDWTRLPSRKERKRIQQERFQFPALPTTTIGSFPQTREVQSLRARFRKGELSRDEYDAAVRRMTAECIALQEEIGLDVLVQGEFERADMVEFFGQSLDGFAFTSNGWVQSYGTRCVKPPIIVSDVSRSEPLTVDLSVYAQSLSAKPVKGMLTGPVTILNWSFPREDIPLAESAFQIALAIREEVLDLERNGISIIQIDEAAFREKMPLRHAERGRQYLDWAVPAFRLCSSGVRPDTQIHTHMCYSDFTDIIGVIDGLDADVISFEAARSSLSILEALASAEFGTDVGPGVWDIHSPRVPPVEEIAGLLGEMLARLGKGVDGYDGLWVNPDCGLKTRDWAETAESLRNLVAAAKLVRGETGPAGDFSRKRESGRIQYADRR